MTFRGRTSGVRAALAVSLLLTIGGRDASGQHAAPPHHTVSGVVSDAETGEPLVGATVQTADLQTGVTSLANGQYRLVLPADTIRIRFSHLGYRPRSVRVVLDRDRILDVALTPVALPLEEIEVVAASPDTSEATRLGAISIDVDEIQRLPAFLGEVDVIKTIQLLPGVQSGAEGTTGLYVRGGGPDQNLILLDGAPVYGASHVFGFLSVFNPDVLQSVRLLKGGFPARYGGRISSVVDLTMKDGNLRRFEADGTLGLVLSSLTVQGPIVRDAASIVVSARRTYIDLLARPFLQSRLADGQSFSSYFWDANARVRWIASTRDRLVFSAYAGSDAYASAFEAIDRTRDPPYHERHLGGAGWGNVIASARWSHDFGSRLHGSAALLYSRYAFDVHTRLEQIEAFEPPVAQSEAIRYTSGVSDLGGRIDFDFRPPRAHRLRFGGSITRHAMNPGVSSLRLRLADENSFDTTLTPQTYRFSTTEGFAYLEDDVRLSARLRANVGIHGSALSVSGATYHSLQPRLSLRYLVHPHWSVEASFGTMQQYLHLLTNSGINLPTDLWVSATDLVRPQRSWQATLGATRETEDWTASIESFYKDMRGLIEYEPGASYLAPHEAWQDKVVGGRGWSYGLELFIRRTRGSTTGWLGYTLSWSMRLSDALNDGRPFPYRYDRRHDVALVLTHALNDRLDVGVTWVYGTGQAVTLAAARFFDGRLLDIRYFDGTLAPPELRDYGSRGGYRMAPYHRLDVALNWHFEAAFPARSGRSTLSVGAYNAYNRKNPFYLFTARGKSGEHLYKQASLFPVLPFVSYRFHF